MLLLSLFEPSHRSDLSVAKGDLVVGFRLDPASGIGLFDPGAMDPCRRVIRVSNHLIIFLKGKVRRQFFRVHQFWKKNRGKSLVGHRL
jgi:hypothetical protein